MSLTEYKRKRNFNATGEPKGRFTTKTGRLYVIQKHAASHLHYDFRLQIDGVLKSWAVPKGPSLNPKVKRLAVHVEDHPLEYGHFEGIIPAGEYGGGTVMLWDRGEWEPTENPDEGYKKGRLKFQLNGAKLHGGWMLVRKGGAKDAGEKNWFLIKERDDAASDDEEIVETETKSIVTSRTMDEIAQARDRSWNSERDSAENQNSGHAAQAASRNAKKPRISKRFASSKKSPFLNADEGVRCVRLVKWIAPQLATLVDDPPTGDEWLHEIKFDGYRFICRIENGSVQFITRNKQDWTKKLGQLAEAAASLPVSNAILDGEVVVLDSSGVSQFQLLQNAFRDQQSHSLHYYVFDLLHLQARDITQLPLERRKELLSHLLHAKKGLEQIHFSDHVIGNGAEFFEQAKKLNLEGIVSKRRNAAYLSGRSHDWLKSKCSLREEFVIGGFTDPEGTRSAFGALLLGYFGSGGKFIYAGKVGTGFSSKTLTTVHELLRPLIVNQSPFCDYPSGRGPTRNVHWVAPKIVAQIEFSNWTDDGRLRHPAFLGLREDKPATDVQRELPESAKGVETQSKPDRGLSGPRKIVSSDKNKSRAAKISSLKAVERPSSSQRDSMNSPNSQSAEELEALSSVHLTHPEKVLYPSLGITKLDVAGYYASVERWILPYIENRLAVLVRCPDGADKKSFYQKHPGQGTPKSLRQVAVREKNSTENYLVIEDLTGLVWLAQAAALEIHVWGSRVDDLEKPDRLVFDLDPDPSVPWNQVVDSAHQIRQFLRDLGLESFVKTTGGKGLHLVVPIRRHPDWDEAKVFCRAVATAIETADPERYVSKMSKDARRGKIYVDYLRNQRGATAVAAYSLRATEYATVSVPLIWDELNEQLHPDQFTLASLLDRLSNLKVDPWHEFSTIRQSITATAKKAVGL